MRHLVNVLDVPHKGQYDHLNQEPVQVALHMDDLARLVTAQNYGFVRMLSAMVRCMRERQREDQERFDGRGDTDVIARYPLTDLIERAINDGNYC